MSTINQAIINRVEAFVQDLNELLREAAVQSVYEALEAHDLGVGHGSKGRRGRRARASLVSAAVSPGGRGKRTAEELEALSARLLGYIESHPGEGVEQISKGLHQGSRELILPIRKLLATGKISTVGHKRATKYFAGRAKASSARRRRK